MTPQTGSSNNFRQAHVLSDEQAASIAEFILKNFHNPATIRNWLVSGLVSAGYSGLMALMMLLADPEVFNFSPEGLRHTAKVVGFSMAGALITYLQKPIGQRGKTGDNQGKPDAAGTDQA